MDWSRSARNVHVSLEHLPTLTWVSPVEAREHVGGRDTIFDVGVLLQVSSPDPEYNHTQLSDSMITVNSQLLVNAEQMQKRGRFQCCF